MFNNPEFTRNLWLELSKHRLIAAPLVLALIFFTVLQDGEGGKVAFYIAGVIFGLGTIVWGAYLAYASLVGEVQKRTWDNQRMSALPPFKLVWGKLFGATSFAWYIGLPCLLLMLVLPQVNNNIHNYEVALNLFLGALLCHAFAFVIALMSVKAKVNAPKGLSLVFLVYFGSSALLPLLFATNAESVTWYGLDYSVRSITVVSLVILTVWAWFASCRVMQNVLQVPTRPWGMLTFVIFLGAYLVGFAVGREQAGALNTLLLIIYFSGFIAMAFVYAGAMTESRDLVSVQRFISAWKSGGAWSALKETPYFIVLIVFTLIVVLCLSFFEASHFLAHSDYKALKGSTFVGMGLIFFLMMLRDVGLLYYFSLGAKPQRAIWTTAAYLVLLYVVVPILLPTLRSFLLPQLSGQTVLGIVVALVHLLVVVGLLTYQQKSR